MLKQIWKVTPKVTDGVCWYLGREESDQIDVIGMKKIARDVNKVSDRLQLKKASIDKIKKLSKDNVFPNIIVETGTVSGTEH